MVGYIVGSVLFIMAFLDRHGGDGALSANIELAAGGICMVIQAGVDSIVERLTK